MRVLIADDDRTSRLMLSSILQKQGFEVIEAENGSDALAVLVQSESPKLVILDWVMPGLNGLEVVRRLRETETDEPSYIIMLTARSGKEDVISGLESGANDYLSKPFDTGELRARVDVGKRMIQMQTALLESRRLLEYQALHDPLTGLMNRRAILAFLEKETSRVDRGDAGRVIVGLCDLDHFKQINDTYGHPAGDEVLCWVADLLQKNVRTYDLVGRVGGEEFLLVLSGHDLTAFDMAVFERLRAKISSKPLCVNGKHISVTLSLGVAEYQRGQDVTSIFAAADEALYAAKGGGRNRVVWHGAMACA